LKAAVQESSPYLLFSRALHASRKEIVTGIDGRGNVCSRPEDRAALVHELLEIPHHDKVHRRSRVYEKEEPHV
jgi:hypothetical protein